MNCVCDFSRGQWSCRCGAFKAEQDTKLLKKIEELRAKVSTPWPGLTVKITDSLAMPAPVGLSVGRVDPSGVLIGRFYKLYDISGGPNYGPNGQACRYLKSVYVSKRTMKAPSYTPNLPSVVTIEGSLADAHGSSGVTWRADYHNDATSIHRFIEYTPQP